MKKTVLISATIMVMMLAFYACGNNASKSNASEQKEGVKIVYTCEMHPEVISDKPGKCPKCGMELVKKEVPASDTTHVDSTKNSKGM